MDKSQLLMFRTAQNQMQSQIIIFNSPIDYADQQLIVCQYPSSGYCVVYKRDHYIINAEPNYLSPTKRSFLNECIRQLYLMNGFAHNLHWSSSNSPNSRQEIWQQVDNCLQPERLSPRSASLQRVKRQLFRESLRQRKGTPRSRGKLWGTQAFNFKPLRQQIGRHHIRRGYLAAARQIVLRQLIHENLKREIMNTTTATEGVIRVTAQRLLANQARAPCPLHPHGPGSHKLRSQEALLTQQEMRRAVQSHQRILEESVRSFFYAKELFRLIEQHDDLARQDNQIMRSGCA
ncbi:CG14014 [Drosophila busckii]|uniref:CG14014 n=1 Tax=Drosophila busckii TaxID=30019 RepID=A0A0M4EA25_DROBS|nr:uncharacterized protein LOC108596185 [Drosophila busckii]ALC40115.1 CG14014 [Drosophila busckii]